MKLLMVSLKVNIPEDIVVHIWSLYLECHHLLLLPLHPAGQPDLVHLSQASRSYGTRKNNSFSDNQEICKKKNSQNLFYSILIYRFIGNNRIIKCIDVGPFVGKKSYPF